MRILCVLHAMNCVMVREETGLREGGMDWYVSLSLRCRRKLHCSVNATASLLIACKEGVRDSATKFACYVLVRNRCCPARHVSEHWPVIILLFPHQVVGDGEA